MSGVSLRECWRCRHGRIGLLGVCGERRGGWCNQKERRNASWAVADEGNTVADFWIEHGEVAIGRHGRNTERTADRQSRSWVEWDAHDRHAGRDGSSKAVKEELLRSSNRARNGCEQGVVHGGNEGE